MLRDKMYHERKIILKRILEKISTVDKLHFCFLNYLTV